MVLGKVLKCNTNTFQIHLNTSTFGRLNPFLLGSWDWVVKLCVDIVCEGSIVMGKFKMK